jgi:Mucin-2 protein WxxW repeating region
MTIKHCGYGVATILLLGMLASACDTVVENDGDASISQGVLPCPVLFGICPSDCGNDVCEPGERGVCLEDCAPPPPSPYIRWSGWLNRDTPSGTGDWETLADFLSSQVGCSLPAYIDAKTVAGVSWQSTGEQLTVSPDAGLVCRLVDQSDRDCQDYQVRFGCTSLAWSALPQAWHENIDLRSGRIEDFVPQSVDVPITRFVASMIFGIDGSFSTLRLAPDDAHYWARGTWTRSLDVITVSFVDPRTMQTLQQRYQVAELTATAFRFRRI